MFGVNICLFSLKPLENDSIWSLIKFFVSFYNRKMIWLNLVTRLCFLNEVENILILNSSRAGISLPSLHLLSSINVGHHSQAPCVHSNSSSNLHYHGLLTTMTSSVSYSSNPLPNSRILSHMFFATSTTNNLGCLQLKIPHPFDSALHLFWIH